MKSSIMLSALLVASLGLTAQAGHHGCQACGGVTGGCHTGDSHTADGCHTGSGYASGCLTCQNIWDGYCEAKPPCLGCQGHHGSGLLGRSGGCASHCGGCGGGVGIYGHGLGGCCAPRGHSLMTGLFHKIKHRVRGSSCCDDALCGDACTGGCDAGCSSSAGCAAGQTLSAEPVDSAWEQPPVKHDSSDLNDIAPIPPEAPAPQAPEPVDSSVPNGAVPPTPPEPPAPPAPELDPAGDSSSAFHWLQPHLRKLLRN